MARQTPGTGSKCSPKPQSCGVKDIDAFVDIYHLRPADWNVYLAHSDEFFGECGLVAPVTT